jgi:cyclophilin family peptidyl-prolyl cis-trans isomerase
MVNNSSSFVITLAEQKNLDGKNIVIGQVVSGMDVLKQIAAVPVDLNERPRIPITIISCGSENEIDENQVQKVSLIAKFEENFTSNYESEED